MSVTTEFVRRRLAARAPRSYAVCGGAGFLGAHLCMRLLRAGHHVICVDNFATAERESIEHLLAEPAFVLLEVDVAEVSAEQIGHVSAIFNLACAASPLRYRRRPLDSLLTSICGTENLLQIASACGIGLFQASTSDLYAADHPQTGSSWSHLNTVGSRACYDEGKRCAETLCDIYRQQRGAKVHVGRIFDIYGPGMRFNDGRVISNFIVQALSDAPLTVYGDGSQTRSLCYVDDLTAAVLEMAAAPQCNRPIDLGNPTEVSMLELAEHIIRLTGSRSSIELHQSTTNDPPYRRPDLDLAQHLLGWQPSVDLDTGLALTIEDIERRRGSRDIFLPSPLVLPVSESKCMYMDAELERRALRLS